MNHYNASPLPVQQKIANFALDTGEDEPFSGWLDTVNAVNEVIPEEIRDASDPSVVALISLYEESRIVDPQVLTADEAAAFARVETLRDVIAEDLEAQGIETTGHPMITQAFTDVAHAALNARVWQDQGELVPA